MDREQLLSQIKKQVPVSVKPVNLSELDEPGLIVVDEVNGFCTPGAGNLAPPQEDKLISAMVDKTSKLAQAMNRNNRPVMAFRDTHEPGVPEPPYPPHCEKGTGEEELVPALKFLEEQSNVTLMNKDCINGFVGAIDLEEKNNKVVDWLNNNRVKDLVVVGICTDICVMDFVLTLLSAKNHGMLPYLENVYVDDVGTSTYDLPKEVTQELGIPEELSHPQNITDYFGLYFMASRGATIVNVNVEG